jgi:hypothetical protein
MTPKQDLRKKCRDLLKTLSGVIDSRITTLDQNCGCLAEHAEYPSESYLVPKAVYIAALRDHLANQERYASEKTLELAKNYGKF